MKPGAKAATYDPKREYCPNCRYATWKKNAQGYSIYIHGGTCNLEISLPNCYKDHSRPAGRKWPRRRPVSIYTQDSCPHFKWKEEEDG